MYACNQLGIQASQKKKNQSCFIFWIGQAKTYHVFFYVAAPTLAPLVYEADHSTQVRLRDYVVSHVFTDLEEEEPEEEDGN